MRRMRLAWNMVCAGAVLWTGCALANPLHEEVRQDRLMYTRLLGIIQNQLDVAEQLTGTLRSQIGDSLYVPDGFSEFIQQNRAAIRASLDSLADDKPMTGEAMFDFRKAFAELPADELLLFQSIYQNTGTTAYSRKIGSGATVFPVISYGYDDKWRLDRTSTTRQVAPDEGRYLLDQLVKVRIPAVDPRFLIGQVILESTAAADRLSEIQTRRSAQADEVARLRRQVAEARKDYYAAVDQFISDSRAERDKLAQRLQEAGSDTAQIARERGYSRTAVRNLAINSDVLRESLEQVRDRLAEEDAKLAELERQEQEIAEKVLPPLISIKTGDAELVGTQDLLSALDELNEDIAEFEKQMRQMRALRDKQRDNVIEAAKKADAASLELGDARFNSTMVQGATAAAIQLADLAVSSRGNPYVFVGLAATQASFNVFVSPPSFYEAKLSPTGDVTTTTGPDENSFLLASIGTTLSKTRAERVANYLSPRFSPTAGKTVLRPASRLVRQTHKQVVNHLAKALEKTSRVAVREGFIAGILQGLIVDASSEKIRQVIAEEMEVDELRAYAKAQAELAFEIRILKELAELEDRDEDWLRELNRYRDMLRQGFGAPLDGRARFSPMLEYRINRPFEAVKDYAVTIRFAGAEPPDIDVFWFGQKLAATEQPDRFLISGDLLRELAKGAPIPLDLKIALK